MQRFAGSGVYALYYHGDNELYRPISGSNTPIYVGKAIPKGTRRGFRQQTGAVDTALYNRLKDHQKSIAACDLELADFRFRALPLHEDLIIVGENHLIAHGQPVWNRLLDGFGLHDPGKERYTGKRSQWDTMHPGRPWAFQQPDNALSQQHLHQQIQQHYGVQPTVIS